MARRIKSKKRKYLGNRTWGGGNTKNRRGKGSKGGKGHAGYHKQNWLRTIKRGENKPEGKGFHNTAAKVVETIKLEEIIAKASKGLWPKDAQDPAAISVNLSQKGKSVKVIGNDEFAIKATVTAHAFSKSARERIEKAGGKAIATFTKTHGAQDATQ